MADITSSIEACRVELAAFAASVSTCFILFQIVQMDGRLFRTFVNVRNHRALLQRAAQFGSKKTTGLVTGHTRIETINETANHRRILIDYVGEYLEIVVVDNNVDLATQGGQSVFDDAADLFHVFVAMNAMAFEIDEEPVFTGMVANRRSSGICNSWSRKP